jgi:hypothetical protein
VSVVTLPDPSLPSAAPRLSDQERSQRLDAEVDRYVRAGFRVVSRTPTAAQLVKPKTFNMGCALLGFLFLLAGLVLYLLYYVSKRDASVYLTVDEFGIIHRQAFGDVPNLAPRAPEAGRQARGEGPLFGAEGPSRQGAVRTGDNRLACAGCGYENSSTRTTCKRCRSPLLM